jgi:antitoxin MazE
VGRTGVKHCDCISFIDTEREILVRARIHKWGNSLALRIPKAFAAEARLREDSAVEISLVEGRLVIAPVTEPAVTLGQLLAGVTEENLHREVETGPIVGNEQW